MDTTASLLRFARRFFAGTLLSRMSGALRDVIMAFCFGSAPEIAAFMVAYRLANLFRRLFGEGNLQAGFIPHFEELDGRDPKRALLFYRDTAFSLLALLVGVVIVMELFLFGLAKGLESEWAKIAHLAMWMVPGLIFICLYALNSSFLQTRRTFFVPAVAPVFFNFSWIAIALFVHRAPIEEAVRKLSLGITVAYFFQWTLTAFEVHKRVAQHLSWKSWIQPQLFSPEWRLLLKPLSLGIIGVGAVQINAMCDAIFARVADPSGPAFLWYAIRVEQLPLALFGIALSGALLPALSRAMQQGALDRYRELLHGALLHSISLMIPCSFALIALGRPGLNLLFGRGEFSAADVFETLRCLWGYAVGLIPSALVLLLASGSYARKNYGGPLLASLFSVLLNIFLNALFVFWCGWGAMSIALATSGVSFANCFLLERSLRKKIGSVFSLTFWSHFFRLCLAAGFATFCTLTTEHFLELGTTRTLSLQLGELSALSLLYLSSFLGAGYLLGTKENLMQLFRVK